MYSMIYFQSISYFYIFCVYLALLLVVVLDIEVHITAGIGTVNWDVC